MATPLRFQEIVAPSVKSPESTKSGLDVCNEPWCNSSPPKVSVVVLGFKSETLLASALSTLIAHSSPRISWELILVLNGASQAVRQLGLLQLANSSLPVRVLEIAASRPGAARNRGVRAARGEVVLFLDDDTEIFQDLLEPIQEIFGNPLVVAAGGPNLTPPRSGALERATGEAMSVWFGSGGMHKRYGGAAEGAATEHSLILCNLAVRRTLFLEQKGFATHLISNEENVLLQRLEADGGLLWHSERLAVHHRRRKTWAGLWEQAGKYGSGRAQNVLLMPQTLQLQYLLPSIFLLYLFSLPLWSAQLGELVLFPAFAYLALSVFFSFSCFLRQADPGMLLQLFVFPVLHLGYGYGFLRALCSWGFRRKELLKHAI